MISIIKYLTIILFCSYSFIFSQQNKYGKFIRNAINESMNNEKVWITWIYFSDKGNKNINDFSTTDLISEKSLQRRLKVNPNQPIDFYDLPVEKNYVEQIKPYISKIRQYSKWLNAVSVEIRQSQIEMISKFQFVKEIELIERFRRDYSKERVSENSGPPSSIFDLNYGLSLTQNQQINVPAVHNTGNNGTGITICVLDAGFNRLTHESFSTMNIIATYDFVNHRTYVGDGLGGQGEGSHGTQTLSAIGGYKSGQLIGPAFGSTYILAKTENTDSETPVEMDNWIAGVEWADSIGVDVTSTSLGYLTFDPPYPSYTWQNMNGRTAVISIASTIAARKGILVANSAGNEGYDASHNTLGAPADADSILSVGSVGSTGIRSSFSSVGNTIDGRVKPDIMAMGSSTRLANPYSDNTYTNGSGTSFSCPLAAGVASLVLAENPYLTPMQVINAMRNTASNSSNPNRETGWGILNAYAASNYFNIKFFHSLSYDSTNAIGPYTFNLKLSSRLPIQSNKVKLIWQNGSTQDTITMTSVTPDSFTAQIYGNGIPAIYKYYFYAETSTDNVRKYNPTFAPVKFYSFRIVSQTITSQFTTRTGWNLISVPVAANYLLKSELFPTAISSAFYYNNSYIPTDSLTMAKGYWLKFQNQQNQNITGTLLKTLSVPISDGWNLIGTIHDTINTANLSTIPTSLIISPFFGYNGSYATADLLTRGNAYWVKANGNGQLVIQANQTAKYKQNEFSYADFTKLTFRNSENFIANLYLSKDNKIEMPPAPPSGSFDVRFEKNLFVSDNSSEIINIQNPNFPIEISIESNSDKSFELYDVNNNELIGIISKLNKISVNKISQIRISEILKDGLTFNLSQNYPNPFNPSTVISYSSPINSHVSLIIYDILGKEIVTLINKEQPAGKYSVEFDGTKYSSGIYYYELRTGDFSSVRKMILIK